MAALAGHKMQVFFRSDTTAPTSPTDEITGANDAQFSAMKDLAESTDFKDSSGTKTRIALLEDVAASFSGDWQSSDTVNTLVRTQFDAGATSYLTIYLDPSASAGSKGYRLAVLIQKYDAKGSVNGKAEWSVSFVGNGAKLAV